MIKINTRRRLIRTIRTSQTLITYIMLLLIAVGIIYLILEVRHTQANDGLQNNYLVISNQSLTSQNEVLLNQMQDLRGRLFKSEKARVQAEDKRDSLENAYLFRQWGQHEIMLKTQLLNNNKMVNSQMRVLDTLRQESKQYASNYTNLTNLLSNDEFAARVSQSAISNKLLGRTVIETERGTIEVIISKTGIEAQILKVNPMYAIDATVLEGKGRVNGKKAIDYIEVKVKSNNPALPASYRQKLLYKEETVRYKQPETVDVKAHKRHKMPKQWQPQG